MQPKITYTPTNTANFGESGEAVKALQTKLNTQNMGKAGYTPLNVDGRFGPLTQAASNFGTPKSSLIANSNSAKMQGMKDGSELSQILGNYSPARTGTDNTEAVDDEYTGLLDQVSKGSDLATQRLVAEIKATKQNGENKLDKQYDSYKRGLQLLGIQHNEATFSPDLLAGHINEAETEHQDKLKDLQREETKGIMEANQAKLEGDLATLKTKMDYVRQIRKDKSDELNNYYETISKQDKTGDVVGAQLYDAIIKQFGTITNAADHEELLKEIAAQFKIPLGSLVKGLGIEKERRDKIALDTKDKNSIINNRGKTGNPSGKNYTATNIPDDIAKDLRDDIGSKKFTLEEIYAAYPEVSSSYVSSLFNSLQPKNGELVNPFLKK